MYLAHDRSSEQRLTQMDTQREREREKGRGMSIYEYLDSTEDFNHVLVKASFPQCAIEQSIPRRRCPNIREQPTCLREVDTYVRTRFSISIEL